MFDFMEIMAQDAIYGKHFEDDGKKLIVVYSLNRTLADGSTLVLACESSASFPSPLFLARFPKQEIQHKHTIEKSDE